MKLILTILLFIAFIGPSVDDDKSVSEVFKDALFNYVSSIDKTTTFLSENFEIFRELQEIPLKTKYEEVMKDRVFVKHTIESGQTLDMIIRMYNSDVDNMEKFRQIILNENKEAVSSDYSLKSGVSILVPSEM